MQAVEHGLLKKGDLLIFSDGSTKTHASDYSCIGVKFLAAHCVGVYRKLPVAHQGDNDPTWKKIQEDAKALTYDDGKPPLADLPWLGLAEVAKVQAYGAKKYGDTDNYRKGLEVKRQASCALRHIAAFLNREDNDPESGKSHIAHACCRLLFLLQNQAEGVLIDDRYNSETKQPNNE